MDRDTTQKHVLITGGASGIGLGIAEYYASRGYQHVSIMDIQPSPTPPLQALMTSTVSTTFSYYECDISSWSCQAAAFKRAYNHQGRIDIVHANAGISPDEQLIDRPAPTPLSEPVQPPLRTLDVNLTGNIYTVNLAIHYLRLNAPSAQAPSRGSIIITASNAGIYAFPIAPVYAASKAGVIGLTRSLAPALAPLGIQINALAPAVLKTNITSSEELFDRMVITPMSTLTRAVHMFLSEPWRTGQLVEVHGSSVTVREAHPVVDEDTKKNLGVFEQLGYAW